MESGDYFLWPSYKYPIELFIGIDINQKLNEIFFTSVVTKHMIITIAMHFVWKEIQKYY